MKRLPGESFEEYRARRKGEDLVTAAHLKGRLSNGMYVDPALHRTMKRTEFRRRFYDVLVRVGIIIVCFSIIFGWIVFK